MRNSVSVEQIQDRARVRGKKVAFTLAEVLITLGIIGVVAAMTMPALVANITERVNSYRQANIAYKVTKAMDEMRGLGLLATQYSSTDAFVDELQKHLKIAKRCDANHITECWPTQKVTTSDGEEFDVSKAKTGKNLNIKSNTSNNVGLILADGATLILTYNQDSEDIDENNPVTAQPKSLPVGFGKSKDFAYTSSVTAPIDFVMDVNGQKGPNSETIDNQMHDIRSFKAAHFSKGCAGVEISGIGCVVNLGTSYAVRGSDNFERAKKACSDLGMSLPDTSTLQNLCEKHRHNVDLGAYGGTYWSTETRAWVWHKTEEFGLYCYTQEAREFWSGIGALCVGN